MKSIKKYLATIAMVSALGAAGTANAALSNWYLDSDGAGGNAPILVRDYLDLIGVSYVHNTFTSATTFSFNESAFFSASSADGPVIPVPIGTPINPPLAATFTGSGTGTVGGSLTFTGGTLLVSSGVTPIATFNLLAGSANLAAGTVLPNGAVSFIFQATSMSSGYFFDSAMNDLAGVVSSPGGVVMGFGTTNVIPLTDTVAPALIGLYNTAFDPDQVGPVVPNGTTDLHLSNNGQFRLQVPEPGSLALVGLSLIGLAGLRRRKA